MEVAIEGMRFVRAGRDVLAIPGLRFAGGRTTALLGPNGAGKTTLLRLIAALDRPETGKIRIGGAPVRHNGTTRERVAYSFQKAVFIGGTVRTNLDLGLRLRGLDARTRSARIEEAAGACGIAHLLERDAHRVSGGEAQRANLARALCLRAPVTLLDEPLSGLDGPARRQLLGDLPGLLRDFATTTIVVTHDRGEALRLADDLVVLIDGCVHAAGTKRDVVLRPPDVLSAEFLGYTIIPGEKEVVAIAPGALRPVPGEVCFTLNVHEVVDLGTHREAAGAIGPVRVSVPIKGSAPDAGAGLTVSAAAASVIRFPKGDDAANV